MSEQILIKNLPPAISGIYKLNYPNGKIYIGQSCDIKRRMYEHNNINRLTTHKFNPPCDLAIQKYGAFETIEILEYCDPIDLNEREQYWIKLYDATNKNIGYNLTEGGFSLQGENHPEATFTNEEVLDIRKRRFLGERKINVYKDYQNHPFGTFERIWLGRGYNNVGKEYIIPPHTISRQVYSSKANSGENNGRAKLTENDIREIRRRYDNNEKIKKISQDFPCVNYNTIRRICKRETWKNIV